MKTNTERHLHSEQQGEQCTALYLLCTHRNTEQRSPLSTKKENPILALKSKACRDFEGECVCVCLHVPSCLVYQGSRKSQVNDFDQDVLIFSPNYHNHKQKLSFL